MPRAIIVLLCLSCLVLSACQRAGGSAAPAARSVAPASEPATGGAAADASAAASAPAQGAPDDGKQALMQEAFPDWGGERPYVMLVAEPDPKGHDTVMVATAPEQVVAIDATHRVLVVSGTISDEAGHLGGAHAMPGNLGAYWFELRDKRWFVTRRRDSIVWSGFMGNLGAVKPVELGGAHHAVSIENGTCWQGFCADYLEVVEFDAEQAHDVIGGVRVSTTSTGAKVGCAEVLAGGKPDANAPADDLGPDDCFDIDGQWHVEPRDGGERGDLVVAFSGAELVADAGNGGKVPRKIAETLVLRYADGAYKPVSGKNPTHDF